MTNRAEKCLSTWEHGGPCPNRAAGSAYGVCEHGHARTGELCATHLFLMDHALCRDCAEGPSPHHCPLRFEVSPWPPTREERARGLRELDAQTFGALLSPGAVSMPPHLAADCPAPGACPFHGEVP